MNKDTASVRITRVSIMAPALITTASLVNAWTDIRVFCDIEVYLIYI